MLYLLTLTRMVPIFPVFSLLPSAVHNLNVPVTNSFKAASFIFLLKTFLKAAPTDYLKFQFGS